MNISKVYYEELKSKCVGGKWESVRIGAMVDVGNDETYDGCLNHAKTYVKMKLVEELGEEKNKEVKKMVNELNKEIQCLLATL